MATTTVSVPPKSAQPSSNCSPQQGSAPPPCAVTDKLATTETDPKVKWVESRRRFIGGSDAYKLLNEMQYGQGCSRALAYEKLGVEPDFDNEPDSDMEALFRRGNILEPVVAALYKEETGRDVICGPKDENGFPKARMHKEFPWAGVHFDRMIRSGSGGVKETGDLEIKTRAEGPFFRMLRSGPFAGDFLQTQWSNFVTGHNWSAFVALGVFGGIPIRHYDFAKDNNILEIFKREGEAFANIVWGKGDVPAHPIPADDIRCKVCAFRQTCRGEAQDTNAVAFMREHTKAKGDLVQIEDPDLAQALRDRDMVKAEIKSLTSDKEEEPGTLELVERRIYDLQRSSDGERVQRAFVLGYGKSYLTPTAWSGIDASKLKTEHPEVYAQVFIKGRLTGSETLRTYPAK
jgi:predicted phage-related endonuclease